MLHWVHSVVVDVVGRGSAPSPHMKEGIRVTQGDLCTFTFVYFLHNLV